MAKMDEVVKGREKGRHYTLNVDYETYQIIERVAEESNVSRPKILAAFVEVGLMDYHKKKAEKAKAAGKKR